MAGPWSTIVENRASADKLFDRSLRRGLIAALHRRIGSGNDGEPAGEALR
jgi:hypothetical protein